MAHGFRREAGKVPGGLTLDARVWSRERFRFEAGRVESGAERAREESGFRLACAGGYPPPMLMERVWKLLIPRRLRAILGVGRVKRVRNCMEIKELNRTLGVKERAWGQRPEGGWAGRLRGGTCRGRLKWAKGPSHSTFAGNSTTFVIICQDVNNYSGFNGLQLREEQEP